MSKKMALMILSCGGMLLASGCGYQAILIGSQIGFNLTGIAANLHALGR